MMDKELHTLWNYESLVRLDSVLNGYGANYPFSLNECATYTQHQITLYQANYCHTDTEPTKEQPSIEGGATVCVVLI